MMNRTRAVAMWSGVLGATASSLGKFAFGSSGSGPVQWWVDRVPLESVCLEQQIFQDDKCRIIAEALPRGILFVAMITCNALMLGSFVQGLEESGSVAATGLSTASNFCASAVLGYLLWDETFELKWFAGLAMIVLGVWLLSSVKVVDQKTKETKAD